MCHINLHINPHYVYQTENTPFPGKLSSLITISDPIKKDAASTMDLLKKWGIKVFLLTGDNIRTATAIAKEANIPRERIFAGVLPKQKVSFKSIFDAEKDTSFV